MKIAILGGYGRMGKLLAKLFADEGHEVLISGPDAEKGRRVASELGVEYVSSNREAARRSEVVVVAVPISVTPGVIEEVAPLVRRGGMLVDVTSVKLEPCKAMLDHAPEGVELLGTHPVFAPSVGSVADQLFILTPLRKGPLTEWFKELLRKRGARLIELSPEEHDKLMAVVQGLTHFAFMTIGKTLHKLGFEVEASRRFASPVYELMLNVVGRIIGQDPKLYAGIQLHNPYAHQVRRTFVEAAKELEELLARGEEREVVKAILEVARHFGDVKRAIELSERAIYHMQAELKELRDLIGKEVCLRNLRSGVLHFGVLRGVSSEALELEFRGKQKSLKLASVELVKDPELVKGVKRKLFGSVRRDYSVVFGEKVNESLVVGLLRSCDEDVLSVEVKDIYRSPKFGEGKKSVCFRVEFISRDVPLKEARVREMLCELGGELR